MLSIGMFLGALVVWIVAIYTYENDNQGIFLRGGDEIKWKGGKTKQVYWAENIKGHQTLYIESPPFEVWTGGCK